MTQKILNVDGMSCSHCVNAVTKAVTALNGVDGVIVDLPGKTVAVDYDESKVSLAEISDAIEEEGYDVV